MRRITCPVEVSECKDVHCSDEKHRELLDIFGAEVLCSMQEAAESTLPKAQSNVKHSKSLA